MIEKIIDSLYFNIKPRQVSRNKQKKEENKENFLLRDD